jgi:spore germination protein
MSEINSNNKNYITAHQCAAILIGSMVSLGMINLPADVVKNANQDGWIAAILGIAYPVYLVIMASFMAKTYPEKNILHLSKMCFGKVIGNILNLIFISFFILAETTVAAGLSNVLKIYITPFLESKKILIVMFMVPAFIAYKGLVNLARVNEVIFYITLPIFLIPIGAIKEGTILNLMPVFDTPAIDILKATKNTFFAYTGAEILFLIYPFVKEKDKIKSAGLKASVITAFLYLWITFITIYYLGIDIVPKFLWPVITVSESVMIPIINSFRYVAMVLNSILIFRTLANNYYAVAFSVKEMVNKWKIENIILVLYVVFFIISLFYGNPVIRRSFINKIMPIYVPLNLLYITVISICIFFKKGDKNVQKK